MLNPLDLFGLRPIPDALRQAALALRGAPHIPRSRFGLSSLGIFFPRLAVSTWLGQRPGADRVLVTNLFNRTQTPVAAGWSVLKTRVRDFRGGAMTYDSHNGTDFTCPVGTLVVAPAPGRVVRVSSEFNRGGVKVVLDHGDGLMTTSNHLLAPLVRTGDVVRRGDPIARSGASGLDMLTAFPWNAPHVHFNTWLNGVPVDPYALPGEVSLWRRPNDPGPALADPQEPAPAPTPWDEDAVSATLAACRDPALLSQLRAAPPELRAAETIFLRNYYPTAFPENPPLVRVPFPRTPRLDLPFRDFSGAAMADTLGAAARDQAGTAET
jgi:murein DD-endopeptidase MepM/ murein hydrolase activator NlpD